MVLEQVKKLAIVVIGAFLYAAGLNLFLIPANVYASGFTGVAQLLSSVVDQYAPFYISTGVLMFLLNIPIGVLGWLKVGRSFTVYSILSVALTSVFMGILPEMRLSHDILLNTVFGGVISAIGIGLTLKFGASTGGLDIVSMVLANGRINGRHIFLHFERDYHFDGRIIARMGESIIYPCRSVCHNKGD